MFAWEFAFLWIMNVGFFWDQDFREIRRVGREMKADSVFQPLCWLVVFCLCVCFFFLLSGFPNCVSLLLICIANMVVLLFTYQFLLFFYVHLQCGITWLPVKLQHKALKEYRLRKRKTWHEVWCLWTQSALPIFAWCYANITAFIPWGR